MEHVGVPIDLCVRIYVYLLFNSFMNTYFTVSIDKAEHRD